MAENEKALTPDEAVEAQPITDVPVEPESGAPKKGKNAGAAVKEWFRKKAVALKRKPQNIAGFFLLVTAVYFMLVLYKISIAIFEVYTQEGIETTIGICIFVTTLLSLLVLVSFLNSFPKRKKPNIFFIVLVFLMIAAMIISDVMYYVQVVDILNLDALKVEEAASTVATVLVGQTYIIVHIVLLGVSAIVFALLPVYKKLINKINTKVELESATENMQGTIDIQED